MCTCLFVLASVDRASFTRSAARRADFLCSRSSFSPRFFSLSRSLAPPLRCSIDTPGVISRVSELFKGHNALILGFNTFLPPGYHIEIDEQGNTTPVHPGGVAPAASAAAAAPAAAGASGAAAPAAPAAGLAAAPAAAVPKAAPIPAPAAMPPAGIPPGAAAAAAAQVQAQPGRPQQIDFDQAIGYVTKIKNRFGDNPEIYKQFLDILHTYQKEQTTIKKVYEQVATLFKNDADLLEEFTQFLPYQVAKSQGFSVPGRVGPIPTVKPPAAAQADASAAKRKAAARKKQEEAAAAAAPQYDKRMIARKARADEDFGPSYRLLPKHFPHPECSERTQLCLEILNDDLVSVPAGSEEAGDAHRKSQFDEILFQCEDDRCELDIVIEQNLSTIRLLQPLADKIKSIVSGGSATTPTEQQSESIAAVFNFDMLKDIHRASIQRIYGERGGEVLEAFKKSPATAIPLVLKRLQQKDAEWRTSRKELNKFWREIYDKNHQKSTDQQTANFKTLDKKVLNIKNIIQDMDIRSAYDVPLRVDMKDGSIHNDILFLFVQFCGEDGSVADYDQLKNFWKMLLVPFYRIAKKNKSQHLVEEAEKIKKRRAEQQQEEEQGNGSSSSTSTPTSSAENQQKQKQEAGHSSEDEEMKDAPATAAAAAAPSTPGAGGKKSTVFSTPSKIGASFEGEQQQQQQGGKKDEEAGFLFAPIVEQPLGRAANAISRPNKQVFYADTNLMLFLRFYQILYKRLQKAKELAERHQRRQQSIPGDATSDIIRMHEQLEARKPLPNATAGTSTSAGASAAGDMAVNYYGFIHVLGELLDGNIDQSKYEEECKQHLGQDVGVVTTMFKLFRHMLKLLKTIVNSDMCSQLVEAYNYERQRKNAFVDRSYLINAAKIISQDKNETLYRFKFSVNKRVVTANVVTKNQIPAEVTDQNRMASEEKGLKYVEQYISSGTRDDRARRVFLARNKRKMPQDQALKNVIIVNGLECKVCIATYKMFFVEETEDLFRRVKGSAATAAAASQTGGRRSANKKKASSTQQSAAVAGGNHASESKKKRLHSWIDRRLAEINNAAGSAAMDEAHD